MTTKEEKSGPNRRRTQSKRPSRRTVLKQLSVAAIGTTTLSSFTTTGDARQSDYTLSRGTGVKPNRQNVFTDNFQDGNLAWTTVENQDWWSEDGGKLFYRPGTTAGDAGNNYLYADATYEGNQGVLEWPMGIKFRGYAQHTSAPLGAWLGSGGPKDSRGTPRLGINDDKYRNQFHAWNSQGKNFTLSGARDNNEWYTYRIVPDLQNNVVRIGRNGKSWTIPEPNDQPIGNTSVVLSGVSCWGCGGAGYRQYDHINVFNVG